MKKIFSVIMNKRINFFILHWFTVIECDVFLPVLKNKITTRIKWPNMGWQNHMTEKVKRKKTFYQLEMKN